jgi:hypothetical protein
LSRPRPGTQRAELFKIAEAGGESCANAIFFHGLGGDAHTTWQADKKDKAAFWLPWLAQGIEGLSVYSVRYEAPVSNWHGSAMELADRAANALESLLVEADLRTGEKAERQRGQILAVKGNPKNRAAENTP